MKAMSVRCVRRGLSRVRIKKYVFVVVIHKCLIIIHLCVFNVQTILKQRQSNQIVNVLMGIIMSVEVVYQFAKFIRYKVMVNAFVKMGIS
jgi:hypothetical protein